MKKNNVTSVNFEDNSSFNFTDLLSDLLESKLDITIKNLLKDSDKEEQLSQEVA
jgi:hypothetical protein